MISTHILDTSVGSPASDVQIKLAFYNNNSWSELESALTNEDGRIKFKTEIRKGKYRLSFSTQDYFKRTNKEYFFDETPVVFNVSNTDRDYHIPLLINPFGYSTYRGS